MNSDLSDTVIKEHDHEEDVEVKAHKNSNINNNGTFDEIFGFPGPTLGQQIASHYKEGCHINMDEIDEIVNKTAEKCPSTILGVYEKQETTTMESAPGNVTVQIVESAKENESGVFFTEELNESTAQECDNNTSNLQAPENSIQLNNQLLYNNEMNPQELAIQQNSDYEVWKILSPEGTDLEDGPTYYIEENVVIEMISEQKSVLNPVLGKEDFDKITIITETSSPAPILSSDALINMNGHREINFTNPNDSCIPQIRSPQPSTSFHGGINCFDNDSTLGTLQENRNYTFDESRFVRSEDDTNSDNLKVNSSEIKLSLTINLLQFDTDEDSTLEMTKFQFSNNITEVETRKQIPERVINGYQLEDDQHLSANKSAGTESPFLMMDCLNSNSEKSEINSCTTQEDIVHEVELIHPHDTVSVSSTKKPSIADGPMNLVASRNSWLSIETTSTSNTYISQPSSFRQCPQDIVNSSSNSRSSCRQDLFREQSTQQSCKRKYDALNLQSNKKKKRLAHKRKSNSKINSPKPLKMLDLLQRNVDTCAKTMHLLEENIDDDEIIDHNMQANSMQALNEQNLSTTENNSTSPITILSSSEEESLQCESNKRHCNLIATHGIRQAFHQSVAMSNNINNRRLFDRKFNNYELRDNNFEPIVSSSQECKFIEELCSTESADEDGQNVETEELETAQIEESVLMNKSIQGPGQVQEDNSGSETDESIPVVQPIEVEQTWCENETQRPLTPPFQRCTLGRFPLDSTTTEIMQNIEKIIDKMRKLSYRERLKLRKLLKSGIKKTKELEKIDEILQNNSLCLDWYSRSEHHKNSNNEQNSPREINTLPSVYTECEKQDDPVSSSLEESLRKNHSTKINLEPSTSCVEQENNRQSSVQIRDNSNNKQNRKSINKNNEFKSLEHEKYKDLSLMEDDQRETFIAPSSSGHRDHQKTSAKDQTISSFKSSSSGLPPNRQRNLINLPNERGNDINTGQNTSQKIRELGNTTTSYRSGISSKLVQEVKPIANRSENKQPSTSNSTRHVPNNQPNDPADADDDWPRELLRHGEFHVVLTPEQFAQIENSVRSRGGRFFLRRLDTEAAMNLRNRMGRNLNLCERHENSSWRSLRRRTDASNSADNRRKENHRRNRRRSRRGDSGPDNTDNNSNDSRHERRQNRRRTQRQRSSSPQVSEQTTEEDSSVDRHSDVSNGEEHQENNRMELEGDIQSSLGVIEINDSEDETPDRRTEETDSQPSTQTSSNHIIIPTRNNCQENIYVQQISNCQQTLQQPIEETNSVCKSLPEKQEKYDNRIRPERRNPKLVNHVRPSVSNPRPDTTRNTNANRNEENNQLPQPEQNNGSVSNLVSHETCIREEFIKSIEHSIAVLQDHKRRHRDGHCPLNHPNLMDDATDDCSELQATEEFAHAPGSFERRYLRRLISQMGPSASHYLERTREPVTTRPTTNAHQERRSSCNCRIHQNEPGRNVEGQRPNVHPYTTHPQMHSSNNFNVQMPGVFQSHVPNGSNLHLRREGNNSLPQMQTTTIYHPQIQNHPNYFYPHLQQGKQTVNLNIQRQNFCTPPHMPGTPDFHLQMRSTNYHHQNQSSINFHPPSSYYQQMQNAPNYHPQMQGAFHPHIQSTTNLHPQIQTNINFTFRRSIPAESLNNATSTSNDNFVIDLSVPSSTRSSRNITINSSSLEGQRSSILNNQDNILVTSTEASVSNSRMEQQSESRIITDPSRPWFFELPRRPPDLSPSTVDSDPCSEDFAYLNDDNYMRLIYNNYYLCGSVESSVENYGRSYVRPVTTGSQTIPPTRSSTSHVIAESSQRETTKVSKRTAVPVSKANVSRINSTRSVSSTFTSVSTAQSQIKTVSSRHGSEPSVSTRQVPLSTITTNNSKTKNNAYNQQSQENSNASENIQFELRDYMRAYLDLQQVRPVTQETTTYREKSSFSETLRELQNYSSHSQLSDENIQGTTYYSINVENQVEDYDDQRDVIEQNLGRSNENDQENTSDIRVGHFINVNEPNLVGTEDEQLDEFVELIERIPMFSPFINKKDKG